MWRRGPIQLWDLAELYDTGVYTRHMKPRAASGALKSREVAAMLGGVLLYPDRIVREIRLAPSGLGVGMKSTHSGQSPAGSGSRPEPSYFHR